MYSFDCYIFGTLSIKYSYAIYPGIESLDAHKKNPGSNPVVWLLNMPRISKGLKVYKILNSTSLHFEFSSKLNLRLAMCIVGVTLSYCVPTR